MTRVMNKKAGAVEAKSKKPVKPVLTELEPGFDPAWYTEEAWPEYAEGFSFGLSEKPQKPESESDESQAKSRVKHSNVNVYIEENPEGNQQEGELSPRQRKILEGWKGYP